MNHSLGLISLVVRDYDDALDFFINKVGFELVEDTYIKEQEKRWVVANGIFWNPMRIIEAGI